MNLDLLRETLITQRAAFSRLSRQVALPVERLSALADGAEPSVKEWRLLSRALRINTLAVNVAPAQGKYEFLFRSPAGGRRLDNNLLSKLSGKLVLTDELQPPKTKSAIGLVRQPFVEARNYLDAEANAALFRQHFVGDDQLRPLHDLPTIAEKVLGINIFLVDTSGIEGASVVVDEDAFIFLARRFQARMLFTLAHEVAHILFHQGPDSSFASFDYSSAAGGGELVSKSASRDEMFAHAFASALLMPDVAVGRLLQRFRERSQNTGDLGDIEINVIARFFGVSFLAAAVRCEGLRLLPPGGAVSLNEWVNKEFGSAEKRARALGMPERENIYFPYFPEALLATAIARVKDGSLSIGRAAAGLGITVDDLITANGQMVH